MKSKTTFLSSLLTVLFLNIFVLTCSAQITGSIDTSFDPGTGADNSISATDVQSTGKIIIGGTFISFNGTTINKIARLNNNGSLDNTFTTGSGPDATVITTAIQTDDKIIVGGNFTTYNGVSSNYIGRLNSNGTIDNSFNVGTGANSSVYKIAIQADGKIIIGGNFTTYNGISKNYIVRLNSDGSIDNSFTIGTGANGYVTAIAIQNDNKIIIGGNFTDYNGTAVNRIARLNTDGTIDNTFNTGTGADAAVQTIAIQNDGKVIVAGNFISINSTSFNYISRLNTNGTIDNTFTIGTGASYYIRSVVIQPDGKIILGGYFTSFDGSSSNGIVRINNNGTIDNTFVVGAGANDYVRSVSLQTDGKIIIGGYFTSYDGTGRNRIARINNNISVGVRSNIVDEKENLIVYPNPTNSYLHINNLKGKILFNLFDLHGNLVLKKETDESSTILDISMLAPGVYTLVSDNYLSKTTKKVVINP